MDTTGAVDTALQSDRVRWFLCGRASLPGHEVRILEAAGQVVWSEGTFTGSDSVFGAIAAFDTINDGVGDQAPQLTVKLNPPNDAAAADLSSFNMQGSPIKIWMGVLADDGSVIPDPYLLFSGILDQPELVVDMNTREVSMDCVSDFELLFMNEEGNRLSPAHHKEIWPGETGLDAITGVTRQLIWGPGEKIGGGGGGFFGGVMTNSSSGGTSVNNLNGPIAGNIQ